MDFCQFTVNNVKKSKGLTIFSRQIITFKKNKTIVTPLPPQPTPHS